MLDYVFIGACHLGPSGAALGTVLSQTISVITALIVILRRKTGISLKKQDFRPDAEVMKQVLKSVFLWRFRMGLSRSLL